ncbi:MAG: hypothetical protein WBM04_14945 [Candidatus Korobacteraceae bacterium]
MKHRTMVLTVLALAICMLLATAPASQAQGQNSAQAQKLAMVAKQLNLTPQQKVKLMPILADEAPKVEAIKANTSLTGLQKMEQLRALHEQTNPEVQAILSPQQYEQLQQIRQHEIEQMIQKKRAQQPQ